MGGRLAQGEGADGRDEAVLADPVVDAEARDLVQRVGEDAEAVEGAAGAPSMSGSPPVRISRVSGLTTRSVATSAGLRQAP